jgi:hypothetical protein
LLKDARLFTRLGDLLKVLLCGLLPLSIYAYIPLRAAQNPPINYAHATTWARFKYLVTGEQFRGDMVFLSPAGVQRFINQLTALPHSLQEWFTPVGGILLVVLGAMGLEYLYRKDWRLGAFLTVFWFVPLYHACTYNNGDVRRYYFAALMLTAIFAAQGAEVALQGIQELVEKTGKTAVAKFVALGLSLLLLVGGGSVAYFNWNNAESSHDYRGTIVTNKILSTVKLNAVIIPYWLFSTSLWYTSYVTHDRPDVLVLDDRNIEDDGYGTVEDTIRHFLGKRPIYIMRVDPNDITRLQEKFKLHLTQGNIYSQDIGNLYEILGSR